ncbi:MAG: hypothetical protein WA941_11435 [Nitrososphaeraceae archaeon]
MNPPVPTEDAPLNIWKEFLYRINEINVKELSEELILCKKKNEMLDTRYHTQIQAILGELRRRNRFYEVK